MFKDKGLNPTSNCLQNSAHTKTRFVPLNTHSPHSCGLTSLGLYLLILPLPPPVFSWPEAKPCRPHYCIFLLSCCPDQSPIRYASPSPLPTSSLVLLRSQWDSLLSSSPTPISVGHPHPLQFPHNCNIDFPQTHTS